MMKKCALILLTAFLLLTLAMGCGSDSDPTKPEDGDNNGTSNWTKETVISNADYPSLVLGGDGKPRISYLDYNDGYVKYGVYDGSAWTISSVGKVSNPNGTIANGGISSLALDAAGNPYITYYDYGNADFKLASKQGNSWLLTTIALPNDPLMSYASPFIPWEESSIVIDQQSGLAHVALQMTGGLSGNVTAYWRTGLARAVILDGQDENSGSQNAIALDQNGNPGISYEARGDGLLKYAHWNGSAFDIEQVAPMPLVYWRERLSAIAYDANNTPHIAYYGPTYYKYARKNGATWTIKDIPYQSGYPDIAMDLDAAGSPHIALIALDTGNAYRLKHARLSGDAWAYDNIDDDVNRVALAVAPSGKIHIVYAKDLGELKYAHN